MAEIKYTKTELRSQQFKLNQLEKYLPTLQLKKAMLQAEILYALNELEKFSLQLSEREEEIKKFAPLLTSKDAETLHESSEVKTVNKHYENIAGIEVPIFENIFFKTTDYSFFDTPFWIDTGIVQMHHLIEIRERMKLLHERKKLLEKELREVSIRVNLFEKIMIPRTKENIKKIKIFLGDQQLAAVSQAKVAKRKILERKKRKTTEKNP